MERRDFLTQSTLLSVVAVLAGACNGLGGGITGPDRNLDVVVNLDDYPALGQAGGVARISGTSTPVALVNMGSGTFAAFSLVCPHQGSTVQWTGSAFVCPNHGARFASDGHWTGGQPTSNLYEYVTQYDMGANTVHITGA